MWAQGRAFEAAQDRDDYADERMADAEERAALLLEKWLLGLKAKDLIEVLRARGLADAADTIEEEISAASLELIPSCAGD